MEKKIESKQCLSIIHTRKYKENIAINTDISALYTNAHKIIDSKHQHLPTHEPTSIEPIVFCHSHIKIRTHCFLSLSTRLLVQRKPHPITTSPTPHSNARCGWVDGGGEHLHWALNHKRLAHLSGLSVPTACKLQAACKCHAWKIYQPALIFW